jgi:hypothetical protein
MLRLLSGTVTARAILVLALLLNGIAAPHDVREERAVGTFASVRLPYLPGSMIPIHVDGLSGAYRVGLVGPGTIENGNYRVPDVPAASHATLVAGNADGLALHTFALATPPAPDSPFLAVACYDDDGIVLHQAAPPYRMMSLFSIGGAPGDIAIDPSGRLATAQTDGESAYVADLDPWRVTPVSGVLLADEIAFDARTQSVYITDRDVDGTGALTRVASDGTLTRRILGMTAEGIAIDAERARVYVANVNDGTVSDVDANTMVERRRFPAVSRAFSLTLSPGGRLLYVVSNQSLSSPFAQPGSVVAIDLRPRKPRIVARSPSLAFPVAAALDARRARLFVTDESANVVYVLSSHTLKPVHEPLPTCGTPWKPALDGDRLYVPCAGSNEIDVFDLVTLHRAKGAPFKTGGYPLAVAVWHGRR